MRFRRRHAPRYRYRGLRRCFKQLFAYFCILLILSSTPVLLLRFKASVEQGNHNIIDEGPKNIFIPHKYLKLAYEESRRNNVSFPRLLMCSAYTNNFNYNDYTKETLGFALKAAKKETFTPEQESLYKIYAKIFVDLKVGPIPRGKNKLRLNSTSTKWLIDSKISYDYSSADDFGDARTYGSDRKHEGNDLLTEKGTPIVSMTSGKVTKKGWNELGGERVGITSDSGTYFYYAHMDRYAKDIEVGKDVKAGDVIGYVGDTGYGPEGTRGKIVPHLHVQIGYTTEESSKYNWFNPYDVIKFLDDYRVTLVERI